MLTHLAGKSRLEPSYDLSIGTHARQVCARINSCTTMSMMLILPDSLHQSPPFLGAHPAAARVRAPSLCASYDDTTFNRTLCAILEEAEAECASVKSVVTDWLDRLDENFIPDLGSRIDAAEAEGAHTNAEPLLAIMLALDEIYGNGGDDHSVSVANTHRMAMDKLIDEHWGRADGSIPEHEELLVDLHGLPDGAKRPYVGERASAYGEVTRDGARILFESMGLVSLPRSETARQDVLSSPAVFADLGSGAGRLVAQAWLELPSVIRAIGVELSPSRHAVAVSAWSSAVTSGDVRAFQKMDEESGRWGGNGASGKKFETGPEYVLGSMLEADLKGITHIYVSSLCMRDSLLDTLWNHIECSGTDLQVVASLRPFQQPTATAAFIGTVDIRMSWNRVGGDLTPVYLYRLKHSA